MAASSDYISAEGIERGYAHALVNQIGERSGRCLSCDNRRTESCRRAVSVACASEHGCIAPTVGLYRVLAATVVRSKLCLYFGQSNRRKVRALPLVRQSRNPIVAA